MVFLMDILHAHAYSCVTQTVYTGGEDAYMCAPISCSFLPLLSSPEKGQSKAYMSKHIHFFSSWPTEKLTVMVSAFFKALAPIVISKSNVIKVESICEEICTLESAIKCN